MIRMIALLTALMSVIALPAFGQSACLPHGKLVDLLSGRYSEQRIAMGLESNGRLFEIFAKDDGATWTMVVTTPNGASCVVAAGVDWQVDDSAPLEKSNTY